ncbi:MAG: hypothetical protein HKN85_10065 [Gammaproteobacteria bacterium]|nr:hypothetical protein [Gammaproteobacteria bacterium]
MPGGSDRREGRKFRNDSINQFYSARLPGGWVTALRFFPVSGYGISARGQVVNNVVIGLAITTMQSLS